MVVVTHSMSFARSVANRVHVFAEGAVVEEGPPAEVLSDPRHAVTRSFLAQATR
jgi:polar amino acid transport system ATP-binding protein